MCLHAASQVWNSREGPAVIAYRCARLGDDRLAVDLLKGDRVSDAVRWGDDQKEMLLTFQKYMFTD